MDKKEDIKNLLLRYINEDITKEDARKVGILLKEGAFQDIWNEVINEISVEKRSIRTLDQISKYDLWDRILSSIEQHYKKDKPKYRFKYALKYAAIILMTIGVIWSLHVVNKQSSITSSTYTEKTTPKGVKSNIRLSDGSTVRLNANSSLQYPEYFDKDKRVVILEGEAFFEVAENTSKPFIIKSGNLTTTVLGTSFNIKAFPESDRINVAVLSGEVSVEATTKDQKLPKLTLLPSDMAVFAKKSNTLSKTTFDHLQEFGWKDGILYFKNNDIEEVFSILETWYGVTIVVDDQLKINMDKDYTGIFDNKSLKTVLEGIGYVCDFDFDFEIVNKKVTIKIIKPKLSNSSEFPTDDSVGNG